MKEIVYKIAFKHIALKQINPETKVMLTNAIESHYSTKIDAILRRLDTGDLLSAGNYIADQFSKESEVPNVEFNKTIDPIRNKVLRSLKDIATYDEVVSLIGPQFGITELHNTRNE